MNEPRQYLAQRRARWWGNDGDGSKPRRPFWARFMRIRYAGMVGIAVGFAFAQVPPALQQHAEAAAVYGARPDYTKPWSPEACQQLAVDVALGALVRQAGGRKSLYMGTVIKKFDDPTDPVSQEALAELSAAWDRKDEGLPFFHACMQLYFDARKRPKAAS